MIIGEGEETVTGSSPFQVNGKKLPDRSGWRRDFLGNEYIEAQVV